MKDYNSNSGGKYAEYYTPHAVARIMADILVRRRCAGKSAAWTFTTRRPVRERC
ncbi:hypothetical protein ACR30T_01295 [Neisseria gonorrhoeae]